MHAALPQPLHWLIFHGGFDDASGSGVPPLAAADHATEHVRACHNGVCVTTSLGKHALGYSAAVLTWLAGRPGDAVRADFAALGGVRVRF
jgi:hypothetical protein